MKKNYVFAFIGVAASGKTNLVKYLCDKYSCFHLPTVKTRERRPDDIDQTIHVSKKHFEEMIKKDELLEYTIFNNHYYGTPKKILSDKLKTSNVSYAITADRIGELKSFWPDTIAILVTPKEPVLETIEKRLNDRNAHPNEKISDKLKTVAQDLADIAKAKEENLIDYVITTFDDDHKKAFDKLDELVESILKVEA